MKALVKVAAVPMAGARVVVESRLQTRPTMVMRLRRKEPKKQELRWVSAKSAPVVRAVDARRVVAEVGAASDRSTGDE